MAESPNLDITHVAASQNNKEITINDAVDALDKAICDYASVDMSSAPASVSLATIQQAVVLMVSNPAGEALTLAATKRLFIVYNTDASDDVDVTVGATVVTVAADTLAMLYMDGTTDGLYEVASGGGGGATVPLDTAFFIGGTPSSSELVGQYVVATGFSLPSGLTGSQGKAGTAATGACSFTLIKNGSSIGTIDFAAAGTVPTYTFTSAVSFVAGDYIGLIAPSSADATLADISITLTGTRT